MTFNNLLLKCETHHTFYCKLEIQNRGFHEQNIFFMCSEQTANYFVYYC